MKRTDQLSHELRDRVGILLRELLEISSETVVTVTRVALSKSRERATVYVSVLPIAARTTALAAIGEVSTELQRRLHQTLGRRRGPSLYFQLDPGPAVLDRLDRLSRALWH